MIVIKNGTKICSGINCNEKHMKRFKDKNYNIITFIYTKPPIRKQDPELKEISQHTSDEMINSNIFDHFFHSEEKISTNKSTKRKKVTPIISANKKTRRIKK